MKKLIATFTLVLLLVGTAAQADPAIVLNQPNPHYGDTVDFTGVYPKVATRRIGTQQHWNPAVQVDCYRDGVRIYSANTAIYKDKQAGGGELTGVSGPVHLGGTANGWTWTEGAATCSATLWYFGHDELTHFLAQITFEVAA